MRAAGHPESQGDRRRRHAGQRADGDTERVFHDAARRCRIRAHV